MAFELVLTAMGPVLALPERSERWKNSSESAIGKCKKLRAECEQERLTFAGKNGAESNAVGEFAAALFSKLAHLRITEAFHVVPVFNAESIISH